MNHNNDKFIIDDINKFIESTRILVFNSFGKSEANQIDELSFLLSDLDIEEINELNQILTQHECEIISQEFIKKEINKKTKIVRFTISTNQYMAMIESFNSRMISNMLNNMVNKGLLETAYDVDSNDFVFWVKESGNIE